MTSAWSSSAWSLAFSLRHDSGTGRCRTTCGHQNQRPSSAAMDGVMKDLITRVSNNRPMAIVEPTCARTLSSPKTMVAMVSANTRPADVTTEPVPPMERMMPVFNPAGISSLNRETSSRL